MILDSLNQYSDAQAITASAKSTNVIDHLAPDNDLGAGEDLYLLAIVTEAFTDAGSDSTVAVALETDDNSPMASPVAIQSIGTFGALSAIGAKLLAKLAPGLAYERYTQIGYTVAGGNLTTGKISCFLLTGPDVQKFYANNSVIS